MEGINNKFVVVPLLFAQQHDGALVGDVISLKNYNHADIFVMIGNTLGQAGAITLHKGATVGGSPSVALAFTRYFSTGFVLKYDGPSSSAPAAVGETISGAGGGAGTIVKDLGDRLICHSYNGTTFVDNETVTCSGGKTVVANGIQINEDIMVPRTAASNTFNVAAVVNKMYCIPIDSDVLGDDYPCVELNVADLNTTDIAAWAVLTGPRYISGDEPETAIYD